MTERRRDGRGGGLETLFLDAGGVLVNPNWDRVAAVLGAHGAEGLTGDALRAAEPFAKKALDTAERIQATNDDSRGWLYMNLVLEQAGVRQSPATGAALQELADYHARRNLWETVPLEVKPVLAQFREAGLKLVVVSNANGTLHHQLERLELLSAFDVVLDSAREGVEKPDPRIFEIALERSGSRAERTLHVGDLFHVDVVGARAAGLQGWLLDAGGLYEGCDCPRVASLTELAARLLGAAPGPLPA